MKRLGGAFSQISFRKLWQKRPQQQLRSPGLALALTLALALALAQALALHLCLHQKALLLVNVAVHCIVESCSASMHWCPFCSIHTAMTEQMWPD